MGHLARTCPTPGPLPCPCSLFGPKGHWKSPGAKKDASPPKLLFLLDLKHQTPKIGGFVRIDKCYQVADCRSHYITFIKPRTTLSLASKIVPFFIDTGQIIPFFFSNHNFLKWREFCLNPDRSITEQPVCTFLPRHSSLFDP